jgi:hypothetical protein
MVKRVRLEKAKSKSNSMTLASARWTLFDQPQLVGDEDAATYHELLARIRAAVKPVDIIDEIFITDVASLEWEALHDMTCCQEHWAIPILILLPPSGKSRNSQSSLLTSRIDWR